MARPKRTDSSSSSSTASPKSPKSPLSKSSNKSKSKKSIEKDNEKKTDIIQMEEEQDEQGDTADNNKEWMALIAAFQVYKAAYGDLKVPARFIVPSMGPWPELAWGMKLGQRVGAIRATGKYIAEEQIQEDTRIQRRKILDDLGFFWRLRASSPDGSSADITTFDQIYSALMTYKQEIMDKQQQEEVEEEEEDSVQEEEEDNDEENGDDIMEGNLSSSSFVIPKNFVVPNYAPWPEETQGLPLGKMLTTIRSKAFLKANPDAAEKLLNLGFELDGKAAVNEAKFSLVYKALATYKQMYGDLLVPQPFVIPTQSLDWPEETWGLRLGARVNAIRSQGTFIKTNPERKILLNDLGFEWEISTFNKATASAKKKERKKKEKDDNEEKEDKEFIEGYFDIHSQLSKDFELDNDDDDDYDDNMELDEQSLLQTSASYPGISTMNTKMGAFVDKNDSNEESTDYKLEEEEDNIMVDDDDDDALMPSFAGNSVMQDSRMSSFMKETPIFPPQRSNDEYQAPKDLNSTLIAAAAMAKAVGVIESMGEGKRVVKGKINKKFPWSIDDFGEEFVFEDVVEALTVYRKITGSFAGLETKEFIVPDPYMKSVESIDVEASARAAARIKQARLRGEDSDSLIAAEIQRMESELQIASTEHEWPEHLAGMKLGCIVNRIRDGSLEVKHLPERKAKLDAISFDWGDPKRFLDVPFEKAMCAMFAYFLIRGDLFVYENFIVPHDEPWPSVLGGYALGKVVRRIQELQHFFEAYHPEKVQLLRMIEFSWFPELALPLNPEAGEESWEDMYVEGMGHPFYHLNEPTVDMVETLQAQMASSGLDGRAKNLYNYDVVKDYWKYGDLTDSGKAERDGRWNAADWLWWNGFNQLSRGHEEKYGPSPGLELLRLLEDYDSDKISERDFDEAALNAIKTYDLQELRAEAISAGIDVKEEDNWEVVMQKIMDDPGIQALDSDPEYQRLIEAEIEAEEARIRLRMDSNDDEDDDDTDPVRDIDEDEDVGGYKQYRNEETYDASFATLE